MQWQSIPCKLWLGPPDKDGYGRKWKDGKTHKAHRLAYEDEYGPIQIGHQVQHLCDVNYAPGDFTYRRCVEPAHLTSGFPRDNSAHMVALKRAATGLRNARYTHPETSPTGVRHGSRTKPDRVPRGSRNGRYTKPERTARGERNGNALLTTDIVCEIRRLCAEGLPRLTVANLFGISKPTVAGIVNRRAWKHVT